MKNIIKIIVGFLVSNYCVFNLSRFINRDKLLIIYYHRVVKKEELTDRDDINMYTDIVNFDSQMKFLRDYYNVVSEKEVAAFIESGKFPKYSVWITFDDGWRDNYTNALPILREHHIPATLFVTTGYVNKTATPSKTSGNDTFMDWKEIQEVAESGIFIGAHTVTHRILSELSVKELEEEIAASKNEIENRLGVKVISFAYPGGKKQQYRLGKSAPILEKNNFKLAVSTVGGFNAPGSNKEHFNLRRMGLSYEDTLKLFKLKISLGSFWQG